ncbi:MAG: hypothetical protein QOE06_2095 [Thermoleophilaceae bacterium]|nr:hypothetical protein [Thermoleophilaceae bacterium]
MTDAAGSPRPSARIGIVGRGRMGNALAAGLAAAGYEVDGPAGRGQVPAADVVLLCVPDSEIEAACEVVAGRAALVGHTSGATPLAALDSAVRHGAAVFGLHPLQTIAGEGDGAAQATRLRGAGCAIAGSTPRALAVARELAAALDMDAFELHDEQRAAYHAAASIASNYLLTLEATAEAVAAGAGIAPEDARRLLGPLVRQTVANWLERGPAEALTGPVARGDHETVERQREAVAAASPEALRLFDELTERTRALMAVPA